MQRSTHVTMLVTLLAVLTLTVRADNNPATSSVPANFPYQGRLEKDGLPVNGTRNLRFNLYNQAVSGPVIWTESHGLGGGTSVQVNRGLFTVVLGLSTPLRTTIQDADTLFLGVELEDPDTNQVFELAGRQQLFPSAWSLWSETANTFNTASALTVGGNASVAGTVLSVGTNTTAALQLAANATPWRITTAANNNLEFRRAVGTDRLYARFLQDGAMEFFPGGGANAITFNTDGTVNQTACSLGTSRIGDSCIENSVRAPATFNGAVTTCHGINAHVCSVAEIQTCDQLNTATSDCNALTDVSVPISAAYWTSTAGGASFSTDAFANLACYVPRFQFPPGTQYSNVVVACDGSGSTANAYWCCRTAR